MFIYTRNRHEELWEELISCYNCAIKFRLYHAPHLGEWLEETNELDQCDCELCEK